MAQDDRISRGMNARRCVLCFAAILPLASHADAPANELRFEIPTLPGFQKHVQLLEYPGYIAVVLENNDMHPSLSTKPVVRERGREVEVKSAVIRFTGRNGSTYSYEAGVSLGIGKASITVPATVDLSALSSGKTVVSAKLPLATLIPGDKRERINTKARMLANPAAQQKLLDYLDQLTASAGSTALIEAILLDAYNRGHGPMIGGRDVGDAVPLSEQWMLIVTLAIWFILFPIVLLIYRLRRRRARPA